MSDVEVSGVSKRYDELWAVKRVSFTAPAGSFTSLLGPSGCGKTTTLRLIAGFAALDEGEVRIGGRPVDALPPWRRKNSISPAISSAVPERKCRDPSSASRSSPKPYHCAQKPSLMLAGSRPLSSATA